MNDLDEVEVVMPVWMLKQIRGRARHDIHTAKTSCGRKDAEKIYNLLNYYWEEEVKND